MIFNFISIKNIINIQQFNKEVHRIERHYLKSNIKMVYSINLIKNLY